MPPTTSTILRAVFRRQLEQLRTTRLPRSAPRRFQSSNSGPKPSASETAKAPSSPAATPAQQPVSIWLRLGPLTRAGQAYARSQRNRPWATQIASALAIYFAADISAQRISGKEYVPERTVRNMVIGAVSAVPCFIWFVWLSKSFNYGSHIVSIGVKIVVNQMIFTPTFNTYFFGSQALLAGDSLADTWDRIVRTVPISWMNAWKLWPAVLAFSFTYIPIAYRSVFSGAVAVGWQTYLSFLNRQAEIEEEVAHQKSPVAALPTVEAATLKLEQKRPIAA
ncbi:uncharacterized protein GGS22DRAFT_152349 [Annulohypoxylon maeteangense]|uniref:uncharacterized protein n=1 Tax=Annulohypoxylon maeteangense TaxID=1927788 RepID=UPI0020086969|nr:uncharacterized protein GGS22DRAFT_152349 [Annulohypoxylon maeteangense]KAI0888785.1 hypothetical protein GGS22DRAFT_152349 [Annulohypoxylon maeteangense]